MNPNLLRRWGTRCHSFITSAYGLWHVGREYGEEHDALCEGQYDDKTYLYTHNLNERKRIVLAGHVDLLRALV